MTFFLPDPETAIGQNDSAPRALAFAIKGYMPAVDATAKGHRPEAEALFSGRPAFSGAREKSLFSVSSVSCGESLSSASVVIGIRSKGNKHFQNIVIINIGNRILRRGYMFYPQILRGS